MAELARRDAGRGIAGEFFGFDPFRTLFGNGAWNYGAGVEVQRSENGWTIEIAVPGFKPDQIDVTVEDRVLTVSGKSERRSFQRAFVVPEEVDADAIQAKVENGLLTLQLALHPKAQPRKIAVQVSP